MNCLCVSSIGTWRSMRTNYTILFCQLVWHNRPVSSMATSQKWFTSLIMFSEVLKLPSSHFSPLSFSKLLGKPPQEALKVNLIAPMALMQARDILGIWSFGVIGGSDGRAGRVFIYNTGHLLTFSFFWNLWDGDCERRERERERDLYIYIYTYLRVYVYIYICTYISCITYGQIWSYMVLYINLQMIHVLSLDSCNFTDMTRPCAQGAAASATSCRRPCAALGDLRGTSSAERDGHVTRRGDNGSYGLWKLKCLLIYGQQLLTNG